MPTILTVTGGQSQFCRQYLRGLSWQDQRDGKHAALRSQHGQRLHVPLCQELKEEEWGRQHIYFEVATLEKRYLYRIVASSVLNGEDGAAFDTGTASH